MTFTHQQPFRTTHGDIVTMKALVTVHEVQHVECYETKEKYRPVDLAPMTPEEYQVHLNNDYE